MTHDIRERKTMMTHDIIERNKTMTHDKRERYSTYYSQAFSFQFEDSDLLAQMVCTILIHTFMP